ncbi:MAG: 50S ribosomal protein L9 [Clostridiales bacterium]|nr:50S ribosomal protein L9 [Clostridiales bacterium]
MKVILKQDVQGLGKKEQLVEVSPGYGRNYLLPRGLAAEANAENISIMKSKNNSMQTKKDREYSQAKSIAEKLKNLQSITIMAKAGENGKLFGSITSMDISDHLKKSCNISIDKKKIHLTDSLKSIGVHDIEIKLYTDINVKFAVKIDKEMA